MSDVVAAILVAGGSSSRMAGTDKLWADIGGRPLIAYSLGTLAGMEAAGILVVVAPVGRHEELRRLAADGRAELRCVEGGARRQDSVAAGIAAAPEADWYLVHDAARPLVTPEVCQRVLAGAREHGAAVPAVPVADTIKRVDEEGRVLETLGRASLRVVQTPQGFAAALLRRAHAEVTRDVTDDAAQVEALGEPVFVVAGDPRNFKVTTSADLELARAFLASSD